MKRLYASPRSPPSEGPQGRALAEVKADLGTGGPNARILGELVLMGRRKSKATVNPNNQNGGTSALELALVWGFVGLPLLWGIYGTLVNAMKLFQ
jgi:hypothetical protein